MNARRDKKRGGFSLMEMIAVVTILGIIAMVILPRFATLSNTSTTRTNAHNKAQINSAVERWYVEKSVWPAANLSDISADMNYFPQGLPANPVDSSAYTLNTTTHRVN
jgi:prepilin-type N-terminal cleavage/methylation domain-containing protein